MLFFGRMARQTQKTLIACVLYSNALVNSSMTLIGTCIFAQEVREEVVGGAASTRRAVVNLGEPSCFTFCLLLPPFPICVSLPVFLPYSFPPPLHLMLWELN